MNTKILVEIANFHWCHKHADYDENNGVWRCHKTNKEVSLIPIWRSVHLRPGAGNGSVREVCFFYCEDCDFPKKKPEDNSPVLEGDLIEILSTGAVEV